jgi:hypothetical protein
MALFDVLPMSITGPNAALLPRVPVSDPIESAGSLMLIDPTHPVLPWAGGVPATGTLLPNVLWKTASQLIAGATQANLSPTLTSSGLIAPKGLIERTAKGALHGIISVAQDTAGGNTLRILYPDNVAQYVLDNKTHKYFLSLWMRVTKEPEAIATTAVYSTLQSAANFALAIRSSNNQPTPANQRNNGSRVVGMYQINMAATPDLVLTPPLTTKLAWGAGNAAIPSGDQVGKHGSRAIYRIYLEDMTVSGRSYAEIDAIDSELYAKEVTGAGGRYYGDTFTSPATLP